MLRQFTGLCAAAALLAMSGAAHALKIFDSAPADRAALVAAMENDSFTYASETLLTTAVTDVMGDSTKYYNVGGTGTLVLSVPGDVGADAGDTYLVSVTLDGMVFRTAPNLTASTGGVGSLTWSVATGGAVGDKAVVFRLTDGGINAAATNINVTASYAVSTGGGSATVTLSNQTLAGLNVPGITGTATHGPANVIKVASALKETPTPSNLTASVASSFKKFSDDMTVGHVGSIAVGLNDGHRNATDGAGNTPVDGLNDILQTGQTTVGTTTTANSSVSFMGDFSFTSKVFVHGDDDCGAANDGSDATRDNDLATAETDIRVMEGEGDDAVITGTTMAVNLDPTPDDATDDDAVASVTNYLCIMVQGDDTDDMEAPRIPDTDAYTAMASYTALEDAASGPMGLERMLGMISRDGTTVHIPYMTTYEGYNQRIVISNRSSSDASYEITFRPEAGVTATAMDAAEGMLMANSTVTMKSTDLVELTGSTRTAATIVVEANRNSIDVTSVTVNKESRDTDTVVHHSM